VEAAVEEDEGGEPEVSSPVKDEKEPVVEEEECLLPDLDNRAIKLKVISIKNAVSSLLTFSFNSDEDDLTEFLNAECPIEAMLGVKGNVPRRQMGAFTEVGCIYYVLEFFFIMIFQMIFMHAIEIIPSYGSDKVPEKMKSVCRLVTVFKDEKYLSEKQVGFLFVAATSSYEFSNSIPSYSGFRGCCSAAECTRGSCAGRPYCGEIFVTFNCYICLVYICCDFSTNLLRVYCHICWSRQ